MDGTTRQPTATNTSAARTTCSQRTTAHPTSSSMMILTYVPRRQARVVTRALMMADPRAKMVPRASMWGVMGLSAHVRTGGPEMYVVCI